MNLRQAAEQALECLDYHWDNPDGELEETPYVLKTKQSLRQALAESANSTTNFVEPKALSQTEQEPVAWMYVNTDGECEQIEYGELFDDPSVTPLYTAPPKKKWVGLTDQEIQAERHKLDLTAGWTYDHFARTIEAKLKQKNEPA